MQWCRPRQQLLSFSRCSSYSRIVFSHDSMLRYGVDTQEAIALCTVVPRSCSSTAAAFQTLAPGL